MRAPIILGWDLTAMVVRRASGVPLRLFCNELQPTVAPRENLGPK
ncbi:MAG: hypothetical protein WBX02_13710 [Terriglobales bacterium]